jgi:hypothetical protein
MNFHLHILRNPCIVIINITEALADTIFTLISMPKMEAAGSSLILVPSYQSTRRHIP